MSDTLCILTAGLDTVRGGQGIQDGERGKMGGKQLIDVLKNAAEKRQHVGVYPERRMTKE